MAKITLNPTNNSIITQSASNPAWSSMSLTKQAYVSNNGIVAKVVISGLLKAKTEILQGMIADLGLKAGMEFPLPHTLIVTESHSPLYAGQKAKINPTKPNEIWLDETGQEVYRSTVVELKGGLEEYVFITDKASAPVVVPAGLEIEDFVNTAALV